MKKLCLITNILISCMTFAQVEDGFSDGELMNNPAWMGELTAFKVNENFQLQLNAEGADHTYLSTVSHAMQNSEWQCWVRLNFSPSSNNNTRIYLAADNQDLKGPLNGYYLQLGESGSEDAITLFRQQGEGVELICKGTSGLISSSFIIGIKVIHQGDSWKVFVDPSGGENYQLEAAGVDEQITISGFMGICCKFTSSNSKKMYFDNIYAGPVVIDNTPPGLLEINADKNMLSLLFSESLDPLSAENPANYYANHGFSNPDSVWQDENNHARVSLSFFSNFLNATNYKLIINGVCDLNGNCLEDSSISFSYYVHRSFDVVINEIMADPTPEVGLPGNEYLELYNVTDFSISLDGWMLLIGNSEKIINGAIIDAGGYLLLCSENSVFEMSFFGPACALSSLSLTNAGQSLGLYDESGNIISSVEYNDEWYHNEEKATGGWSLELINPLNPCAGGDNWGSSVDAEGGTPGSSNSIDDEIYTPVSVEKLCHINDSTFYLQFNQLMDTVMLKRLEVYELNNGVGVPVSANVETPVSDIVELTFGKQLVPGTIYTLSVIGCFTNCVGQGEPSVWEMNLGVPENSVFNDLVINEVLFNPLAGGEDYVEIYNRSDKIVNLADIKLASIKMTFPNPEDTVIRQVSETCLLLFPEQYVLLCKDPDKVQYQYFTENPEGFIKMKSFPSYNNEEGQVALLSESGSIIDYFHYHEDMHHPLLNIVDGVSLERIHYDLRATDQGNWHSASLRSGFGTPAYQNSQFLQSSLSHTGSISLDPEIIFPGDYFFGHSSLGIYYVFDTPGKIANILIFNMQGYVVRKLVQNELLGTEGFFTWSGVNDKNLIVSPGIYIILVEVFDKHGITSKYKDFVVVGEK